MSPMAETVIITGMAAGGAGVGKLSNGKVVFAPGTFPGDKASLKIISEKKRHAMASLAGLVEPSPLRREPECPYSQNCGGCLWMGLDYQAQLKWKESIVEEAMARIGRIEISADSILPSPLLLGYRHRVRLKGAARQGGFSFAYRRRDSHDLVRVASCSVAHPRINQAMGELAEFFASRSKLASSIGETLIETDGARCRATFFPVGPISQRALELMIGETEGLDGAAVISNGELTAQSGEPWLHFGGGKNGPEFSLAPGAFSQANMFLNPALSSRVMELSGLGEGQSGLDLYCGAGNYSIPLAMRGASMSGVDLSAAAIESAERSREANSIMKANFTQGDCLEAVMGLISGKGKFSAVIANPPRAGAGEAFVKALELTDERAVYVACDPAPLARDALLAANAGFRIARLEAFDMFPHTPHMETVALFVKS